MRFHHVASLRDAGRGSEGNGISKNPGRRGQFGGEVLRRGAVKSSSRGAQPRGLRLSLINSRGFFMKHLMLKALAASVAFGLATGSAFAAQGTQQTANPYSPA